MIPSLEVGKYYRIPNELTVICWQNGLLNYGFNMRGKWSSCLGNSGNEKYIEMTNEEIEKALTAEAIKRGHNYNRYRISTLGIFQGVSDYNILRTNLMHKGKWAAVVNTEEDELKKALQAAQDALDKYLDNE